MGDNWNMENIPAEKFRFAQKEDRIHDAKFETKPIGYFKDAWLRFKKNKASIVAACIILFIVLFFIIGWIACFGMKKLNVCLGQI